MTSLFRNANKDVFQRTQNHLTRLYSGQMILFLILFIVVVYSVLYVVVMQMQERDLRTLAFQEAKIVSDYLEKSDRQRITQPQIMLAGGDQFFYYAVDLNGYVLLGDEANPAVRVDILKIINEHAKEEETFKATLQLNSNDMLKPIREADAPFLKPARDQIHLLISSAPIMRQNQIVGMLYTGINISYVHFLFNWMLVILVLLAIVFFIVAYYLSKRMSQRAMLPIEQSFQRQREFVADASHELRTPLSVIQSSVEALEMVIDHGDTFSEKLIQSTKDEVKRMTHLLSDLLTLARSDSGKIEMVMEPFDLKDVADKTVEAIRPLAAQKNIQLVFRSEEQMIGIGDEQRLRQLLYILLDNSIKYTPDQGKVELTLQMQQKDAIITVSDTGIGMSEEEQQHIFERFYRVDQARNRQTGGFGLGLSIAKWIVTNHHGTIDITSELNKGSTFQVKIPFAKKI